MNPMGFARRVAVVLALAAAAPCAAQRLSAPADLGDGLRTTDPTRAGLDTTALRRLTAAAVAAVAPKTSSVLIVRGGALAYEAYFGEGTRDRLNDTRSATKSVTSLAVGAAIADGKISSADAKLLDFFADLRPVLNDNTAKGLITLSDLLTMSSALSCNDDDDASPGNEDNMHPNRVWTRWAVDLPTDTGYRRDSTGLGPWRYCTTGAFLLGQVVQRATGAHVDHFVEHRLFEPLGITKVEWQFSPSGEVMTGGGLRLRARDLAKLALLVQQGGTWNGREIVPADWIRQSLSVQRHASAGQDYGYLFWHRVYKSRCGVSTGWYMAGNGGNAILTFENLDAVVVVTRTNFNQRGMHQQTQALLEDYILPAIPCAERRRGGPLDEAY